MEKLNCWQYKNCGREKGGLLVDRLGECPAAQAMRFDGQNGGQAAGRACWLVAKSSCPGNGSNRADINGCHDCEFYRRVLFEEQAGVKGKFHSVPA
jgi:hypothetical protein